MIKLISLATYLVHFFRLIVYFRVLFSQKMKIGVWKCGICYGHNLILLSVKACTVYPICTLMKHLLFRNIIVNALICVLCFNTSVSRDRITLFSPYEVTLNYLLVKSYFLKSIVKYSCHANNFVR